MEQREELWTEFIEEAAERADYPELKETPDRLKTALAEKIRNLN